MAESKITLAWPHRWLFIVLLGLLSLGLIAAYSEILAWVVRGWFSFERSYSLVILLLSLYMIWSRREFIRQAPVRPNLLFGSLLTVVGCLIVVAGKLSNTLMLQGISLVVVLLGLIWLIIGSRHLKIFFIPLGYLFFMFHFLEEALGTFSHFFQSTTAWVAAQLLRLSGMPVALHDNLIELPHITLEVAKVCNGIHHIVALTAMSVPFAFLTYRSALKKALAVQVALFVGILLNGLRVSLIGYWTKYQPEGPLHGPFDLFYVSFILLFGLILSALVLPLSKRWGKGKDAKAAVPSPSVEKPLEAPRFKNRKQWVALSTALAILFLANAYIYLRETPPVEPKRDLNEFPMQIGPWTGRTIEDQNWPVKHLAADFELRRIYHNSAGLKVGLYLGYFKTQWQGKELINDRLNWLYDKFTEFSLSLGSLPVKVGRGVARGLGDQTYDGDRRAFYFWYVVDGRVYLDRRQTKLVLFLNNLSNRRSNGAIALVSIETGDAYGQPHNKQELDFVERVAAVLSQFM